MSGQPLILIRSLQANQQHYLTAKELLTKAFASPIVQKYNVISRLTKLGKFADGDIYVYISEMMSIIHIFDSLKIDIQTVLQFFIWQSMPEQMQSLLVQITNASKPDLEQIKDNIFCC